MSRKTTFYPGYGYVTGEELFGDLISTLGKIATSKKQSIARLKEQKQSLNLAEINLAKNLLTKRSRKSQKSSKPSQRISFSKSIKSIHQKQSNLPLNPLKRKSTQPIS